jgi:hypothetical protein
MYQQQLRKLSQIPTRNQRQEYKIFGQQRS